MQTLFFQYYRQLLQNLWFLGNALLDFSANCRNTMLEKYKLNEDDNCEYSSAQMGLFEELLKKPNVVITPGGSAQNSARVSRWILRDPRSIITFVGCVGNDSYSEILRHKLEVMGVNVCYDYHPTEKTGTTAGLVTSKSQRTLCARLGAATHFRKAYLKSTQVETFLKDADLLYVEGYFLSHSPDCVSHVADYAITNHKFFSLNISAVYIVEKHTDTLFELLPKVDILFGNSREMIALAQKINLEVTDISTAVKLVAEFERHPELRFRIIIATDGQNPVVCCQSGENVMNFPVPPVTDIADTIGAGDAFVGSFLPVWLKGRDLHKSILCGIETAGLVIKAKGCVLPEEIPSHLTSFL